MNKHFHKLRSEIEEVINQIGNIIGFLLIAGVAIWGVSNFGPKVIDFVTPDTWTLMVCKTIFHHGVQCYDNEYVIPGYKSKKECMEKGIEIASDKGFECGSNCKKDYGVMVCKEVCNKAGCS